jgi:hypothetical protein
MSEDEESFLVPAPTEGQQEEKVWCKIGEKGDLEYVDWDMIDGLSKQFDALPPNQRTEQMLIAKLMILVREQTRQEMSHDSGQRK